MFHLGFGLTQREKDAREFMDFAHTYSQDAAIDLEEHNRRRKAELGGFKQNRRAYYLAVAAYLGIFAFGYDTGLGGGIISLPSFAKDYNFHGDATNLKANIVSILQGGSFFGALAVAPVNNALGRKRTLIISCIIFIAAGICQTAGHTVNTMYAGRFFAGFGIGMLSSVAPTYVAEIAPAHIRGNITGLFQVLVVIGVAFSYWINYGVSFMKATSAQWRIPVGFQIAPICIMLCMLPFMKESPRWLASKGRNADAQKNLAWVRHLPEDSPIVQMELAEIIAACEEENEATKGAIWHHELTRKGNPKRFFIAIMFFVCQQWSGQNSINYYAPTIFKSIGITGTSTSLLASGVYGIVKIVATSIFIIFGIERAGRKKYFAYGGFAMGAFLFMIGAVFHTHPPKVVEGEPVPSSSIGMAVLIYLFVIPYCWSWGALCWVYCSEIFSTRTRAYGLGAANGSQWAMNFLVTRFTPNLIAALDKGTVFFFFASINMLNVLWSLWVPETRGMSLESMDVVFGAVPLEDKRRDYLDKMNSVRNSAGDGGSISGGSYAEDEKYAAAEHIETVDKAEGRGIVPAGA